MADIYALPEPINGKIFGHKLEDLEKALKLVTESEMKKLDELEKFAMFFKNARVNFGFTQLDVGHALGPRYGAEFSQTTISRFEACNLSFKNMCKLQPILEQWICEAEKALLDGTSVGAIVELGTCRPLKTEDEDSPMKRRKRRTQLSLEQINVLEIVFRFDQRPSLAYMSTLAEEMSLGFDVVKIWFCNRRQKKKRNCEVFEKPDLNNLKGVLVAEPTSKKKGRRPRHFPPEDDGELPTCSRAAQSSSSTILREFFVSDSSMSLVSQSASKNALVKEEQIFEDGDGASC